MIGTGFNISIDGFNSNMPYETDSNHNNSIISKPGNHSNIAIINQTDFTSNQPTRRNIGLIQSN